MKELKEIVNESSNSIIVDLAMENQSAFIYLDTSTEAKEEIANKMYEKLTGSHIGNSHKATSAFGDVSEVYADFDCRPNPYIMVKIKGKLFAKDTLAYLGDLANFFSIMEEY